MSRPVEAGLERVDVSGTAVEKQEAGLSTRHLSPEVLQKLNLKEMGSSANRARAISDVGKQSPQLCGFSQQTIIDRKDKSNYI